MAILGFLVCLGVLGYLTFAAIVITLISGEEFSPNPKAGLLLIPCAIGWYFLLTNPPFSIMLN